MNWNLCTMVMMIFVPFPAVFQVPMSPWPSDCRGNLHKLPDRIPNLLVQINAIRNNDHSIKNIVVGCVFQRNQLVRQPCNGIRLSRARTVLDQVSLSNSISLGIRQQRSDQLQLVIARKYLLVALFMRFFILIANDLHIIFNDVGEIIFAKDFFPEIICLYAVRIRWIARTIVVTFIERQEPRLLPLSSVHIRTSLSSTAK